MTKPEITGKRDLRFSLWIRDYLPDSKLGFHVTDIDFILFNKNTKKIMLLEIKTKNFELEDWQRNIFKRLHNWLKRGMNGEYKYLGFHKITFENTFFNDGNVYFDNTIVNEMELIEKLSF